MSIHSRDERALIRGFPLSLICEPHSRSPYVICHLIRQGTADPGSALEGATELSDWLNETTAGSRLIRERRDEHTHKLDC